ncbi:MAG: hypothetical protein IJR12_03300 [Bacteroidales bacterium]|nr:hypothetical protein [Bacteroidales bacterium]
MADTKTPQPNYDAIAQQAYEWLKKRRAKGEISTFEVLMKINGYKWGSKELELLEDLDLVEVHDRLLRLIKKGNEYVADFSAYEDMCVGLPYDIPFVFRKK